MLIKVQEAIALRDKDRGSGVVIEKLKEARCFDNTFTLLHVLIGDEYFYKFKYDIAKNEYTDAIKIDKKNSYAWYGLARSTYKMALDEISDRKISFQKNEFEQNFSKIRFANLQFISCDTAEMKKSIRYMKKAKMLGIPDDIFYFEIGRMHESINENSDALKSYYESFSYNSKNFDAGFAYCVAWVRSNHERISMCESKKIIDILETISKMDAFNTKLACAVLWYLFKKIGDEDNARDALNETTRAAMNEMFTIHSN